MTEKELSMQDWREYRRNLAHDLKFFRSWSFWDSWQALAETLLRTEKSTAEYEESEKNHKSSIRRFKEKKLREELKEIQWKIKVWEQKWWYEKHIALWKEIESMIQKQLIKFEQEQRSPKIADSAEVVEQEKREDYSLTGWIVPHYLVSANDTEKVKKKKTRNSLDWKWKRPDQTPTFDRYDDEYNEIFDDDLAYRRQRFWK